MEFYVNENDEIVFDSRESSIKMDLPENLSDDFIISLQEFLYDVVNETTKTVLLDLGDSLIRVIDELGEEK